jgi:hypothetical protein
VYVYIYIYIWLRKEALLRRFLLVFSWTEESKPRKYSKRPSSCRLVLPRSKEARKEKRERKVRKYFIVNCRYWCV